jgi:hypothetical protein
MTNAILVVHTNPVDGREDEYNTWYDKQHLPDVLAVPGFVSATRYRLSDAQLIPLAGFRYLAIYEIEGDPHDAMRALRAALKAGMHVSDAMATELHSTVYEPVGS